MSAGDADRSDGRRRLLIVAHKAIPPDELVRALMERSTMEVIELSLLVPLSPYGLVRGRGSTTRRAERLMRAARARFRAAGLYVRDADVRPGSAMHAALEAAAPGDIDEIVVVAPRRRGRDAAEPAFVNRLRAATGLAVTHVVGLRPAERGQPGGGGRRLAARLLLAIGLALLALAAASAAVDPASGHGDAVRVPGP